MAGAGCVLVGIVHVRYEPDSQGFAGLVVVEKRASGQVTPAAPAINNEVRRRTDRRVNIHALLPICGSQTAETVTEHAELLNLPASHRVSPVPACDGGCMTESAGPIRARSASEGIVHQVPVPSLGASGSERPELASPPILSRTVRQPTYPPPMACEAKKLYL